MTYEVETGSARWASPDQRRLTISVKGDGEPDFHPITISKSDPSQAFAAIFDQATATPPAYGEIGAYVEPLPVEPSAPPPGVVAPITPPPLIVMPPAPIDWDIEAQRFIDAIYTVNGVSVRASMNVWAAAVALKPVDQRDQFDVVCADMTPKLNDWEGEVFAECHRLKSLAGATLADAQWPVLPAGAPQFIQWCREP